MQGNDGREDGSFGKARLRRTTYASARSIIGACLALAVGSGLSFATPALAQASDKVASSPVAPASAPRPNIAIILLDDAGFGATSMFGGLANTPAFDQLAASGVRYNRFHVSAICAPTRASLLSGRNPHQMGFGQIPETAANYPGYDTRWPTSAASIAQHLKGLGYGTAAVGKWHNTPAAEWSPAGPFDRWPTGLGFEHFYGTLGTTSMWEPLLWRGTSAVKPNKTAEQGYNLTEDLVEDTIGWLHMRESLAPQQPYFLYFATTAVHSPHQVPEQWTTPYRGKFAEGWDALRSKILARQKALGLVPKDAVLAPRDKALPAWSSLSPQEKAVAERQMEILAGYMSQTDHEIGRLIDAIRKGPNGKDTMILFIAGDNGSSGEDGPLGCDDCPALPPPAADRLAKLPDIAGPGHIAGSASGWAYMNDTPFPGMKRQASYLGGIRVPMVVSWPGHTEENKVVRSQWTNVTDVAATIYDLLGYSPEQTVNGVAQMPIEGTSFAGSLQNPDAPTTHHVQYFETYGTRSIYSDGWMASLRYYDKPWGEPIGGPDKNSSRWELYNLDKDFSQSRNIAASNPQKLKEMVALFDAEAKRNNVYPLGEIHLWFDLDNALFRKSGDITLYRDATPLYWDKNPDFSRAHRITADVTLSNDHENGLIISSGMRGRGFALYMRDGALVYEAAHTDIAGNSRSIVTVDRTLGQGRHIVTVDVSESDGKSRNVLISVDAVQVAQANVAQGAESFYGSASLNVGAPHNSPVTERAMTDFSGKIDRVVLHFPGTK